MKIINKPKINIGIVSDVVCPWCYIGKRRLEKAIAAMENEFVFDIAYYPFELNSEMPEEGRNNKEYLVRKFGSEDQYQNIINHVSRVAASEGLEFNFDKQHVAPNTRNAHRLIQFAKEQGKQLPVVEALFKAYFTDGVDLSRLDNLVAIGGACGLDKNELSTWLSSDAGRAEVVFAEQEMQKLGISGVPFYIINDKYGVSGAQPAEMFMNAFRDLQKEMVAAGEACDIDGKNC